MPGTTDTVKAILTPGEFVIRKEAVDMIGVPMLNMINNMPEKGGHSNIDNLIARATIENMKGMYGGGMVQAGPKPMGTGGMVDAYAGGGMVMDQYGHGGKVKKNLKPVPQGNPGLGKLPEAVRNKMGYMQKGGMVEEKMYGYQNGGMALRMAPDAIPNIDYVNVDYDFTPRLNQYGDEVFNPVIEQAENQANELARIKDSLYLFEQGKNPPADRAGLLAFLSKDEDDLSTREATLKRKFERVEDDLESARIKSQRKSAEDLYAYDKGVRTREMQRALESGEVPYSDLFEEKNLREVQGLLKQIKKTGTFKQGRIDYRKEQRAKGYQQGGLTGYENGGSIYGMNRTPEGMMQAIYEMPTEDGNRYYLGEASRPQLNLSRQVARSRAEEKAMNMPQDSISFDVVQQLLNPEAAEPEGKKGLMGLLGFENGGPVNQMPEPTADDPLQIDYRMANPEVYQGSTLGVVRQQSDVIEAEIKDNIAKNARLALQKMKLDSVMSNLGTPPVIIPNSLIADPQAVDYQGSIDKEDTDKEMNMQILKRALMMRGLPF